MHLVIFPFFFTRKHEKKKTFLSDHNGLNLPDTPANFNSFIIQKAQSSNTMISSFLALATPI